VPDIDRDVPQGGGLLRAFPHGPFVAEKRSHARAEKVRQGVPSDQSVPRQDADGTAGMPRETDGARVHAVFPEGKPFPQRDGRRKRPDAHEKEQPAEEGYPRQPEHPHKEKTDKAGGQQRLVRHIGDQRDIRRVHGDGNAQLPSQERGVARVVIMPVGQCDKPDVPAFAAFQDFSPVRRGSGVDQNGAAPLRHDVAVPHAAFYAFDFRHLASPFGYRPQGESRPQPAMLPV
jgi:hypothetical protein